MGVRIGALFAGYGGLDLAVQSVYGGSLAWYSEVDKGALKILGHRFPDAPNAGDVTAVDWSQVEPVDILTGGSPCQDLSHAGRRAGMTEGTRSNLWVAMREAIAQLRPSVVVWENVRGAYSAGADSALEFCAGCMGDAWDRGPVLRALGRVLGDLSDLGYDARWHGLRAADIGAPHGRFRVFVVATDAQSNAGRIGDRDGAAAGVGPTDLGHERAGSARDWRAVPSHGCLLPTPRATDGTKGGPGQRGSSGDLMLPSAVALLPTPTAQEPGGTAEQYRARWAKSDGRSSTFTPLSLVTAWGDYAAAIARWERVIGRPAPAPTQISSKGNPQLSAAFVEWMMGLPAGWVTDVPGITRNESLKALGNGVVWQQAAAALIEMASWQAVAA